MSRLTFLAAVALVIAPTTAIAGDGAADQTAKPAKVKKLCRADAPTGSIMTKRTCRTKEEWQKLDEANHANAQSLRDEENQRSKPGGI
jgi:hypothetical protein